MMLALRRKNKSSKEKRLVVRAPLHKKLADTDGDEKSGFKDALKFVHEYELRFLTMKALALTGKVNNYGYLTKVFASRVASACTKVSESRN